MKIAGTATAGAPEARLVEPRRTPVTREELRAAIGRALEKNTGRRPPGALVDVLTAQASLETASGAKMYNFNFGGIKGAGPSGESALCRTREVLEGRSVVLRDRFRAYRSLDEGALDYVRTLERRFHRAFDVASSGDTAAFAHELKKARYYTAPEADYASALARLTGAEAAPRTRADRLDASESLVRASDLLDAQRFADLCGAPAHARRSRAQADAIDEDEES